MRRLLVRLLIASVRPLPDDRQAIWSIPKAFQVVYFLIFIGICVPMIANITQEQMAANPGASWIRLAQETASEFAAAGVGAAIGSLIAMQGVAIIVSLYHIITNRFVKPVIEEHEERGRKEGEERGRKEGIAEGEERGRKEGEERGRKEGEERANRAWAKWNQSRLEHEAQGIPFDEPPPHNQR